MAAITLFMTRLTLTGSFILIEMIRAFIQTLDCVIHLQFVILTAFAISLRWSSTSLANAVTQVAGFAGYIGIEFSRTLFNTDSIFSIVLALVAFFLNVKLYFSKIKLDFYFMAILNMLQEMESLPSYAHFISD